MGGDLWAGEKQTTANPTCRERVGRVTGSCRLDSPLRRGRGLEFGAQVL